MIKKHHFQSSLIILSNNSKSNALQFKNYKNDMKLVGQKSWLGPKNGVLIKFRLYTSISIRKNLSVGLNPSVG